jgi:hypothetical protein
VHLSCGRYHCLKILKGIVSACQFKKKSQYNILIDMFLDMCKKIFDIIIVFDAIRENLKKIVRTNKLHIIFFNWIIFLI